jgi:protein tyrosine/serine phosphatase
MMDFLKSLGRGWTRHLARRRGDMRTPWQRFLAHLELMLVDHGFIRAVYGNSHRVGPGLYRSAQPSPRRVAAWARRGIRTVVNLRGARDSGTYLLEKEACERHGIRLVDFPVSSKGPPAREKLLAAEALFRDIEYPALLHCKSGADRAGLMSALYLAVHEGHPVEQARRQLGLRYGHLPVGRTGILDRFFERYAKDSASQPLDFRTWVVQVYDPEALAREYRSSRLGNLLVDRLLRRE